MPTAVTTTTTTAAERLTIVARVRIATAATAAAATRTWSEKQTGTDSAYTASRERSEQNGVKEYVEPGRGGGEREGPDIITHITSKYSPIYTNIHLLDLPIQPTCPSRVLNNTLGLLHSTKQNAAAKP